MCVKLSSILSINKDAKFSIMARLLIKHKAHVDARWSPNANSHSVPDQRLWCCAELSHTMTTGTESLELLYAAPFPSYVKLLVLKPQELNLPMEHAFLLFVVMCDRLFSTLHFGKQRVCCVLIWCCLQRQRAPTSSDQLCVSLMKVYKVLPLCQEILEMKNLVFF